MTHIENTEQQSDTSMQHVLMLDWSPCGVTISKVISSAQVKLKAVMKKETRNTAMTT